MSDPTPKIPHDLAPATRWHNRQRSILRLAEGGHRKGRPVQKVSKLGPARINENESALLKDKPQ